MASKLFVGSLDYGVNDQQLNDFFAQVGTVVSANVIIDRYSDRSKGFGFVEMSTEEEAEAAIKQLDGQELNGRPIVVNKAKPKENRERRSFDGGNGGGDRRY